MHLARKQLSTSLLNENASWPHYSSVGGERKKFNSFETGIPRVQLEIPYMTIHWGLFSFLLSGKL